MFDRLTGLKDRSGTMVDYIQETPEHKQHRIKKLANEVRNCASYLKIHDYFTIEEKRVVGAHTCKKHLLCPFCAVGRGARSIAKTLPKVETILKQNPHLIPAMLTLTVKNGDDLSERHRHLAAAQKRIVQRRRDAARGQRPTEFSKIHGAIYSHEVTHSEETGWHPHTHMIVLLNDYVDQQALSDEWRELTGDSFVVDIRKISEVDRHGNAITIVEALGEVFKYAVKLSDMPVEQIWTAYKALNGKRLLGGFGSLHGVKLEDNPLEDPLADLPYIEMLYSWTGDSYRLDKATQVNHETGTRKVLTPVVGTGPIPSRTTHRSPPESRTDPAPTG